GAPKRTYIGFDRGFCQPFRAQRSERNRQFLPVFAIAVRHCGSTARVTRKSADYRRIRHLWRATPYCGHIPRPILSRSVGCRKLGVATASLEFFTFIRPCAGKLRKPE